MTKRYEIRDAGDGWTVVDRNYDEVVFHTDSDHAARCEAAYMNQLDADEEDEA